MSIISSKSHSALVSQLLAIVIPISLGQYWVTYTSHPDLACLIFRPALLASSLTLFCLLWYRLTVTRVEQSLLGILAFLCAVLLACSLTATDPVRALQEWVKLVIISAICMMVCRALRHGPTAKAFGIASIIASAVLGALMVATYLKYMGPVLPTYATARVFKGIAAKAGSPLNPISFSSVFAYICGMCLVRGSKLLWTLGAVLLVISTALTGSRAPLAAFGVSGLVLLAINALRSPRLLVWIAGWVLAAGMVLGAAATVATSSFAEMSAITEGRWDRWSVAIQKFSERPLLGYGYLSWSDDLASRLPRESLNTRGKAEAEDVAGGYHNEYVTALAEQGIIGFLAIATLFGFLVRCCWKLTFRHSCTWRNGQWALFGCLVLLLRAGVEVPGLFGYAQEPADFLAYLFLAIVVSRISREEDYIRSEKRRPVRSATPFQVRDRLAVISGQ